MANDPDAVAVQAKDLLGRLEELKTIGSELDEEFQEIVDAWLDEQARKAREVAGGS